MKAMLQYTQANTVKKMVSQSEKKRFQVRSNIALTQTQCYT